MEIPRGPSVTSQALFVALSSCGLFGSLSYSPSRPPLRNTPIKSLVSSEIGTGLLPSTLFDLGLLLG